MAATDPARRAAARVARGARLVRPAVVREPRVRVWDRIEAVLILVLGVVLLGSIPVAYGAGATVFAHDQAADARIGLRYEVTATVFSRLPASHSVDDGGAPVVRQVRAAWTAPDGTPRAGDVTVELTGPSSRTVRFWVDRQGNPQPAPRITADLLFDAAMNGLAVEFGFVVVAALVYTVGRLLLDRRRSRGWDQEWRRLTGADV